VQKKLRKFVKPGETVLVTFNFEGLEKRQAFTVRALAMYGMNMRFRVITSQSIIRIITMRGFLIIPKKVLPYQYRPAA